MSPDPRAIATIGYARTVRALAAPLLVAAGLVLAFDTDHEGVGVVVTGLGIVAASGPVAAASQSVWRARSGDPAGGGLIRRIVAGYLAVVGVAIVVGGVVTLL